MNDEYLLPGGSSGSAAARLDPITPLSGLAGLVEQMGIPVHTVPGDPRNLKITRPEDLHLAEALLSGTYR